MDEILLEWLRASRDLDFILIIADRISGVHGWKGRHRPIAGHRDGSTVIIEFTESEQLTILDAMGLDMDSNGILMVRDASEVKFSWLSQDDLQDMDLSGEEVFQKIGRMLFFSRTGDPFHTSACFQFESGQLVILRPVRINQEEA